jgi:galactokinase
VIQDALPEKLLIEESLVAIKSENISEFGRLINENHILLRDVLEIVPAEIDIMVKEAWKINGVLGSRMTGCGFGEIPYNHLLQML